MVIVMVTIVLDIASRCHHQRVYFLFKEIYFNSHICWKCHKIINAFTLLVYKLRFACDWNVPFRSFTPGSLSLWSGRWSSSPRNGPQWMVMDCWWRCWWWWWRWMACVFVSVEQMPMTLAMTKCQGLQDIFIYLSRFACQRPTTDQTRFIECTNVQRNTHAPHSLARFIRQPSLTSSSTPSRQYCNIFLYPCLQVSPTTTHFLSAVSIEIDID